MRSQFTSFPRAIDSSMLSTFKSCPQMFRKEYIENWKPKEQSVHLHAGAAFAKGIEVARETYFVKGEDPDTAVARGLGALLEAYGDFECPADSAKSAERMGGALEYYFSNYPLESTAPPITFPSGKRGIEFNFVHPLPIAHPETREPILFCGRLDALLDYAGGTYMCDEKTATSLGPTWSRQWDLRGQFTGYAWGCRESGIKVNGAIVRGIAILKTKYDTQEAITSWADHQIDRWYEETLGWIRDMVSCYEHDIWRHNFDKTCADFGGCKFRLACSSQDETPWLETYFERRVWDPITREETKL